MAVTRTLVETRQLALRDLACAAPRGGPGASRGGESTHVVLVRRGAFVAHLGRRQYVADACTALLSWAETEYRMSHPGAHGDDCLVVELGAALEEEALAGLRRRREIELRLSPWLQQAVAGFAASVREPDSGRAGRHEQGRPGRGHGGDVASRGRGGRGAEAGLERGGCGDEAGRRLEREAGLAATTSPRAGLAATVPPGAGLASAASPRAGLASAADRPLATEELALELVRTLSAGSFSSAAALSTSLSSSGDRARQLLARRAVAALHLDLASSPSVSSLAAALSCSPFQLMRAMRAELGTTLRGYRIAARLGAALHRLAEGEADLTRLALELGFASHAHLTSSFVRVFGAPPSQLRASLPPRARTFLKAHRAATS